MRKRQSRIDIAIDLTSLLDVIFIVLLIVMCGHELTSEKQSEEYKAKGEQLEAIIADAQAEQNIYHTLANQYQEQITVYNNMDQIVKVINISSCFDSLERLSDRTILVVPSVEDSAEPISFKITAENDNNDNAYDELKAYLNSIVNAAYDAEDVELIILTLNRDNDLILYKDELAISKIIKDFANEYDIVFSR